MNNPIDSSLPIDKYFEQTDDSMQFSKYGKTLYMESQAIQKAHHALFAPEFYVDDCKEWMKNTAIKKCGLYLKILQTSITTLISIRI